MNFSKLTWISKGLAVKLEGLDWTPSPEDGEGVERMAAVFPGLVTLLLWRDGGGRIDALLYNPEPRAPVLDGILVVDDRPLTQVSLPNGSGVVYRFGPDRVPSGSAELDRLRAAIGAPAAYPFPSYSPLADVDKYTEPDVAGSPRIAQAEPVAIVNPNCPDGWRWSREWTAVQAGRCMLYEPIYAGDVIGEHGLGSTSLWQNPDDGHLEVSKLAAGWLVFRDPVARCLLKFYGQMLLSRPRATVGDWNGELRGIGYTLHDLAILDLCLGGSEYRAAIERLADGFVAHYALGRPYPMLTAVKMDAGSHGFMSPREVLFAWLRFDLPPHLYRDRWETMTDDSARIAEVVSVLKELDHGKTALAYKFFNDTRPVTVWMALILFRGAALAHKLTDVFGCRAIAHHALACVMVPGREAGYDSHDAPVPQAVTVHDAYFGPLPMHKEPAKSLHTGTALWYCTLLQHMDIVVVHHHPKIVALVESIMVGSKPDPKSRAETCWPWYVHTEKTT